MDRWREGPEIRATLVLLAGGGTLVAAGTAGLAASPWLVAAVLATAVPTWLLGRLAVDTAWTRVDRHRFVADLWVGPAIAAAVLVPFLGAGAGEVQALGGLVGLVGMANYFLRPVYHLLYGLARYLAGW